MPGEVCAASHVPVSVSALRWCFMGEIAQGRRTRTSRLPSAWCLKLTAYFTLTVMICAPETT